MAKSNRAITRKSVDSKSHKRKAAARGKKPSAIAEPSDPSDSSEPSERDRAALYAALNTVDVVYNLNEALRAFRCLQSFLAPLHRQAFEELQVTPEELKSLVTCINAETQRRMQAVDEALETMQRALH